MVKERKARRRPGTQLRTGGGTQGRPHGFRQLRCSWTRFTSASPKTLTLSKSHIARHALDHQSLSRSPSSPTPTSLSLPAALRRRPLPAPPAPARHHCRHRIHALSRTPLLLASPTLISPDPDSLADLRLRARRDFRAAPLSSSCTRPFSLGSRSRRSSLRAGQSPVPSA